MRQPELFMTLLVTVMLCVIGVREIRERNYYLGALLILIPVCGWISIWVSPS